VKACSLLMGDHVGGLRSNGGKGGKVFVHLRVVPLLLCVLLSFIVASVWADRGMIPISPEVSVYEPGQKAIVAWNGREEVLLLSTDVSSVGNTAVLEILPLPSNPSRVENGSLESFEVVQGLIWSHLPPPPPRGYFGNEADQVKVVFYEKIGMHGITVVEVHDVSGFVAWMNGFLAENGFAQQLSLQGFEVVIGDYMRRGFYFYVLDLIEMSTEQKSVEPILYKFETSFLYYPLLITSPTGGDGKITLFLITEGPIDYGYEPLTKARYVGLEVSQPIQFEVSKEELFLIDPRIDELFQDKAWMTALLYDGPLGKLTEDVVFKPLAEDLNVDGKVDIRDIAMAAKAFGSLPGDPRWDSRSDINKDNRVDIIDIVSIALHFGNTI